MKGEGMATMKAVRIHGYGGPEVLRYEECPRPEPGAGEVLVKVHAAGVNPVDWKIRAGYLKDYLRYSLPVILGWDLSGVVASVGAGVTAWKAGDEVYSRPDIARDGAYAEYIVVRESEVALKPKSLDHVHAAAIPLAALTAWQALEAGGLSAGQKVLVHAASGGVGSFAVQFAKLKGARVAGTASVRNQAFLKELGVDEPINYETTRFEDVVHDADMVLDALAGEVRTRSWKTLKKGGILVSILGPAPEEEAKAYGVRQTGVMVQANGAQLAEIAKLVDAGKVRVILDEVLPLAEAGKAHDLNATGHTRGKIVLRVV
jgi:NADPH:quinone reductase-like Zn-dependent oxidoreductase